MDKLSSHTEIKPQKLQSAQLLILILLGVLLALLDIRLGSVSMSLMDVYKVFFVPESANEAYSAIIYKIRIPRTVTAILAGAALSVAGLQMQTLFRNPLAGPSVLGITAGASLGVAAVMLVTGASTTLFSIRQLGLGGSTLIILAAIAGAAAVLVIIMAIALKIRDNVVMLIVGLMVANITIAVVSIWQYFSEPEQIQEYILWTFGSLSGVTNDQLTILAIVVLTGIFLTFLLSKTLNVLLLGEDYAASMGLNTRWAKTSVILVTSLLTGAITGFCGPIGFVGIAVPHLTRSYLNTSDHRLLIPASVLTGAILMLLCDIIAQVPGSATVLPVNAITAIIGSPIVIWIIAKRRNLKSAF